MKNRVFGVLTPIATLVLMIGLTFVVAAANQSSDGWGALGAMIMVFMLTGLILIVMLIVSLVVYIKNKSDYALGIVLGLTGIFFLGLITSILSAIINMA